MEEIQKLIDQYKELLEHLLAFIDSSDDNSAVDLQNLNQFIQKEINNSNTEILQILLRFLSNISKNHHRQSNFFPRIEQILLNFKDVIKQNMSDEEIVKYFQQDSQIFVFLIEKQFLTITKNNIPLFYKGQNANGLRNSYYIYKFIKDKIGKRKRKRVEYDIKTIYSSNMIEFEEKCSEGENDTHICRMIRNDQVEEFIKHAERTNYPLSSYIEQSLFETNRFLIENKKTTLIEYASFFGSLQIILYLKEKGVELSPMMWLYSIHSNSPEMIHFLEQNKVEPPDGSYKLCLGEAIKCYHHEIARYIQDNYIQENEGNKNENEDEITEKDYNTNICSFSFRYFNPEFLPETFLNDKFLLFYFVEYNYNNFLKLLLKTPNLNINIKKILMLKRFYRTVKISPVILAILKNNTEIANILFSQPTLKFDEDLSFYFDRIEKLPSSLTRIVDDLFINCYMLEKVIIPESVTTIGKRAFSGCSLSEINIPSSVVSIDDEAFNHCQTLTSVTLPSSLTSIGKSVFQSCSSLKQVTIPSSITLINDNLFFFCRRLTTIIIPSSVTSIGKCAFNSCYKLAEIKIPSSVTSIGDYAFANDYSLKRIVIPSSVVSIGSYAFNSCGVTALIIPRSVSTIGDHAFGYCGKLKNVTFKPGALTSIGNEVFSGCQSLIKIVIPSSVTSIGTQAFFGCSSLNQILIPPSVQSIGHKAFEKCESLFHVEVPSSTNVELDSFSSTTGIITV